MYARPVLWVVCAAVLATMLVPGAGVSVIQHDQDVVEHNRMHWASRSATGTRRTSTSA